MATEENRILNLHSSRTFSAILACFQPIFMRDAFSCTRVSMHTLQTHCQKWGDIGSIYLEFSLDQPNLHFHPPQPISLDELPRYENLLVEECLGPRGRLASLYEKRIERQQDMKIWLSNRLQIFGYHDLPFTPLFDRSEKLDERFEFPIKGTPAQFGVMLRQFALTLNSKPNYYRLGCQILLPSGRKDIGNIPPDANPIEAKLSLGKSLVSIHAHVLPSDGTLLRIHLSGERNLWELWDAIRDELEKLGWFSLPVIPEVSASPTPQAVTSTETQSQPADPTAEIWLTIPDVGANREILRHWHKGLTCEQIAVRVSLSAKTVLNRINKLRKDYGAEVVPYRKSNYITNSRKKSSGSNNLRKRDMEGIKRDIAGT